MRIETINRHMIEKYKRFSRMESLTHFPTTVLLVQFTTFYLFVQQPQKMGINGCSFRQKKVASGAERENGSDP